LAFLGIKGIEYKEKFEKHHVPGPSFQFQEKIPGHPDQYANPQHAQIFFALYFVMTGLHAVHMIVGLGIFGWLLIMAWKGRFTPEYNTPVEMGGLYWHFVDVIWIYLFPLLYLIDRHP
jgi:cytochrome c oxidase subunit 3